MFVTYYTVPKGRAFHGTRELYGNARLAYKCQSTDRKWVKEMYPLMFSWKLLIISYMTLGPP